MAKSNTILIRLVSSAETGYFYVTKKNTRNMTGRGFQSCLSSTTERRLARPPPWIACQPGTSGEGVDLMHGG